MITRSLTTLTKKPGGTGSSPVLIISMACILSSFYIVSYPTFSHNIYSAINIRRQCTLLFLNPSLTVFYPLF